MSKFLKIFLILLVPLLLLVNCGSSEEGGIKTCSTVVGGEGDPEIEFTYVPPIGSSKKLKGQVRHVASDSYKVAVYIRVPVYGLYNKPYWDDPLTTISCPGSWTTDITTGEGDKNAIEIYAFLVPVGYNPPIMSGGNFFPPELEQNAVAVVSVIR